MTNFTTYINDKFKNFILNLIQNHPENVNLYWIGHETIFGNFVDDQYIHTSTNGAIYSPNGNLLFLIGIGFDKKNTIYIKYGYNINNINLKKIIPFDGQTNINSIFDFINNYFHTTPIPELDRLNLIDNMSNQHEPLELEPEPLPPPHQPSHESLSEPADHTYLEDNNTLLMPLLIDDTNSEPNSPQAN